MREVKIGDDSYFLGEDIHEQQKDVISDSVLGFMSKSVVRLVSRRRIIPPEVLSSHDFNPDQNGLIQNFWDCIHIKRQESIGNLIDSYVLKTGKCGIAILEAHGLYEEFGRGWEFRDGNLCYSVQNWVDYIDGRFAAAIIMTCNPNQASISSKRSIVIHPLEKIRFLDLLTGRGSFKVYHPNLGYVC